jgi:hypothetical protein
MEGDTMVEASGYLFEDVEALLKRAKDSMEGAKEEARQGGAKEGVREEAKIKTSRQTPEPGMGKSYRDSLNGSMQKLDEICSRYKDDAEASLVRNKLAGFLEELDSGKLTLEMEGQGLERIIEQVHYLVEWRKLSTATGRDLSLKSRRRTKEDVQKR